MINYINGGINNLYNEVMKYFLLEQLSKNSWIMWHLIHCHKSECFEVG